MNAEPGGEVRNIRNLLLIVLLLNAFSSILFISTVKRPVYDDPNNLPDVHRYATEGVSIETIRQHRNPTGPTSFLWMAAGVRILGGDELRDARTAALASWLLLGTGILFWAARSSSTRLWYFALLVALVFPHTLTASATILTEGPGLLFATVGAFFWLESVSQPSPSPRLFFLSMIGGLSMGVAITCRQYYLALLPAALLLAYFQWRGHHHAARNSRWSLMVFLSLVLATLPVIAMVAVWKGMSSPAMIAATSYGSWKSTIGVNLGRPLIAAFYLMVYLLPLTFPAMSRLSERWRLRAGIFAAVAAISVASAGADFLQPGPLNSFIRMGARIPRGEFLLLFAIATLAIYNSLAVSSLLWEQRRAIIPCAPAVFAMLVAAFFVAEQIGVGGNLPFYDRYVLQLTPFLGLIAFAVLPRLTPARVFALGCLSVLSHVMLWRFAYSI
jgi:hypothetical protein